jgi:hypothetical protein
VYATTRMAAIVAHSVKYAPPGRRKRPRALTSLSSATYTGGDGIATQSIASAEAFARRRNVADGCSPGRNTGRRGIPRPARNGTLVTLSTRITCVAASSNARWNGYIAFARAQAPVSCAVGRVASPSSESCCAIYRSMMTGMYVVSRYSTMSGRWWPSMYDPLRSVTTW